MKCETDLFSLIKGKTALPSLTAMKRLCDHYSHPELAYPTVHVAGTNGKGSVCTKIAACLQKGGYKVGLYTSPHISSVCERIQINGQMIPENTVSDLFYEIQANCVPAAFFEILTLISFCYFQRQKVDIAVIETGLGGRWDATNVVHPLVSVITSIGYDHVDLLGPTLEDIAWEKAGIIKEGIPTVLGPDVPIQANLCYRSTVTNCNYDLENREVASLALDLLKNDFPQLDKSSLDTKPPCRFERHVRQKEILLDVAHNAHGFAKLLQTLHRTYPTHQFRFIIGFSKGKDIAECARLIEEKAHAVHLVTTAHPRLASIQEIQKSFQNPLIEKTIKQALQNALQAPAQATEVIVIAGSFFIMDEVRKALEIG